MSILPCLLAIASMTDRTLEFGTVKVTGKGVVKATLVNHGRHTLRLWSPTNYEGMHAVSFLITGRDGKERAFQPPVPPRAGGVATSIDVEPGAAVELMPIDLRAEVAGGRLAAGDYGLVVVYANDLASRAPVKGVWTGRIQSGHIRIKL